MSEKKKHDIEEPEMNEQLKEEDAQANVSEGMPENEVADAEVELDSAEDQISKLQAELDNEKKEYLFLMAEFDNFRKRTVKEKAEIIKSASGQAMKGLLPIVDDFERGLEATKDTRDAGAVREGMELIYNKLVKFMEANGVKPMQTDGEEFDPEAHEAIAQVPAQADDQKGKIIDTVSKGYTINGKVLRHAKVVVAQ
ncbi:MAG: nucleotide exchange factor GrpE [Prevotella sp.]|nr:nucleotide exchange factor GrpE [Prevotella sp.]MCM1075234.1 nucleotide exchange factor GrpE [Ruminococcus sp.]